MENMNLGFEIIDFHTHPYPNQIYNICNYASYYDMPEEEIKKTFLSMGITKIAGSAIKFRYPVDSFEVIKETNEASLGMAERMGGFYIPGFHIHPDYVEESIAEVRRMAKLGVKLVGELVPYLHNWNSYNHKGIFPILEEVAKHSMVVSFHEMASDTVEDMVKANPDIIFVAAHPGERDDVMRHVERMKKYDNVYLDLSGTGIFRWHMLRYLVDTVGSERILFGSDYPTCNPGVSIGGILAEPISTEAMENIFSKNAKRLLGI